jgi:hypothetical protein
MLVIVPAPSTSTPSSPEPPWIVPALLTEPPDAKVTPGDSVPAPIMAVATDDISRIRICQPGVAASNAGPAIEANVTIYVNVYHRRQDGANHPASVPTYVMKLFSGKILITFHSDDSTVCDRRTAPAAASATALRSDVSTRPQNALC